MMILPQPVKAALTALDSAGFEAYVVGGAVRDHIRGERDTKDWDIATNALPDEVKTVFAGYRLIETGLKHGTVTVVIEHEPLEITTYRVDGSYSDHRRPDAVSFTGSLEEDLERRDFTINALAYSPKTGVVDFHGGLEDIAGNCVRCVGDPDKRFQEDGLRILRAIRFASVLGMTIEADTAAAIRRNKELLRSIAAERIHAELTKALYGRDAQTALRAFSDVIAVPLPELIPMFGFDQHNPSHDRDVWEHTLAVVNSIPAVPVLRWAALLHDIGKPGCFSVSEDGVGHFYGHEQKSAEIAEVILSRLRFDTAGREQIVRLIWYHNLPLEPERKSVRRLLSKLGEDTLRQLLELRRADTEGKSAVCRGRLETYRQAEAVLDEVIRENACLSLRDLAVNGNDLKALGLSGKAVGDALESCLNAVIEETVPNERSALLEYVGRI